MCSSGYHAEVTGTNIEARPAPISTSMPPASGTPHLSVAPGLASSESAVIVPGEG